MGRPLCMHTYSRMFNTCVIPGEECDEIRTMPNDAKHILVLRNNSMWTVEVFDENGEELPFADILRYGKALCFLTPASAMILILHSCGLFATAKWRWCAKKRRAFSTSSGTRR
jgi:hypothetical protein